METDASGTRITAIAGDLTRQDVDVVVNAANQHLRHGGGVAAAIARAGGPEIQRASDAWVDQHGPLADGQAAITTGGELPAKHVVHVAGPVYDETHEDNAKRLAMAVRAALDAAAGVGARSIAFPAISAGIFGYPLAEATSVLADEVVSWVAQHPGALDEVRLVGFDDAASEAFASALAAADG